MTAMSNTMVSGQDMKRPIQNKYLRMKDEPEAKRRAAMAAKKAKEKKRRVAMMWYGLVLLAVITGFAFDKMTQPTVIHSNGQQTLVKTTSQVDETALSVVDRTIHNMFLAGSWRYDGSEIEGDMIHVYIRIPEQLASETDLQVRYIKQSLCPKTHDRVWQFVEPQKVMFHLFTLLKADNVSATCG